MDPNNVSTDNMAEAGEGPPASTRFYCHKCNEEVNIPHTEFVCPICSGGFVEELPPSATTNEASGSSGGGGNNVGSDNGSASGSGITSGAFLGTDDQQLEALRGQIANLVASRNGPNIEITMGPNSMRTQPRGFVSLGPSASTAGGRVRPQSLGLDNVLLDFLQSISVGATGTDGEPIDNSQFLFMGNWGDYAWGREGLDSIVTQLLNQMETSGPPPLPKDKIDEIPKVEITAQEVDRKLQCSVCWEDFKMDEPVRKLPCSHVYHEDCIVPWLNLHGTCPICRKSLSGDIDDFDDVHMVDSIDETPTVSADNCPLEQEQYDEVQVAPPPGARTSNALNAAGSSQPQPPRSNPSTDTIFSFERMDSVDLD